MRYALVAALAAASLAPAALAAPAWNGPPPAVLAAQITPAINKVFATPTARFARAVCVRVTYSNLRQYACTAALIMNGTMQVGVNALSGEWAFRVVGTETNWRWVLAPGQPCGPGDCGGVDARPLDYQG